MCSKALKSMKKRKKIIQIIILWGLWKYWEVKEQAYQIYIADPCQGYFSIIEMLLQCLIIFLLILILIFSFFNLTKFNMKFRFGSHLNFFSF